MRFGLFIVVLALPLSVRAQILPPDLRVPGMMEELVDVPGETWVNGVPTRFVMAHSAWKSDALFRHFFRTFENAGFYIPPESKQLKVGHSLQLSAAEVGSSTTFTVILTPLPDGTTHVILGTAEFSRMKKPGEEKDEVPLPPGVSGVVRSHTEGSATITYETGLTDAALKKHYDTELQKLAFKPGAEVGTYEKEDAQVRYVVSKDGNGRRTVLLTNLKESPLARPQRSGDSKSVKP